ncbi:SKP1-like protein 12 [Cucumis melo var. makuwa]|uniref:SKP1-like protein 12 n=1 Tax=Cucumis melo var. makuwa TaxID=1194695 RepID=A0A5A7SU15_CUCMM|nr:SKP1-like protein 12 [Cucumis melo var. makuwa]
MRTVNLRSSENEIFKVSEEVAKQSVVVRNFLEEDNSNGDEITIPLPNISGKLLGMVIEWIAMHVEEKLAEEDLHAWKTKFMEDLDLDLLFELIMAANYLEVTDLFHATCQCVADKISGKSPEEIRKIFNITNDFTPEEEAEIRRQNAWVFEPSGSGSTSGTLMVLDDWIEYDDSRDRSTTPSTSLKGPCKPVVEDDEEADFSISNRGHSMPLLLLMSPISVSILTLSPWPLPPLDLLGNSPTWSLDSPLSHSSGLVLKDAQCI